jgi:hypothetical protein
MATDQARKRSGTPSRYLSIVMGGVMYNAPQQKAGGWLNSGAAFYQAGRIAVKYLLVQVYAATSARRAVVESKNPNDPLSPLLLWVF